MTHNKLWKRAVLIITVCLIVTTAGAAESDQAKMLVKISIVNRNDLDAIAATGVDIWHTDKNHITAAVGQADMLELRGKGLEVEILIADLDQHAAGIRDARAIASQTESSFDTMHYKPYPEIIQAMSDLEASGIAKMYDIGDSIENRDIWAVKVSDNPEVEEEEPEVLFVGTHHAREWIAAEVPLYLAQQLVQRYDSDPNIRALVDSRQIWIVPVVNPDGLVYSWESDRWWRKNRRYNGFIEGYGDVYGVDLNRNYGYYWGLNNTGSSPDPWTQTYRGTAAFSEPESQAVKNLVEAHDFQVLVSYHNYSQLILHPWGYDVNPAPSQPLLSAMATRMSQLIESVHGVHYTPEQAYELYPTNGTTDDWSYGQISLPSFTIELRPKGEPYFELPEEEILPTCQENWPAALYLIGWNRADLNGDGIVDFNDFSLYASRWMQQTCTAQGWCDGADRNKNGAVDLADLVPFLAHWMDENIFSRVKQPLIWIPSQSEDWRYRKGNSEPSLDWKHVDFVEDETWLPGQTSIGYGDADDNTELSDMRDNYSSVYLRHTFYIESEEDIPARLILKVYVDDGCIVALNNQQEWRFHVSDDVKYYDSTTGSPDHEAEWETFEIPNPHELLQVGNNVLAIHALNVTYDSSDFSIDAELVTY